MSHETIHHDNGPMAILSFILSLSVFMAQSAVTGEVLHWISVGVGALIAFLVQKLCHYLWDKYVKKSKDEDGKLK